MGRAIRPAAIRITSRGAEPEILSASGFWTRLSLLSEGSRENLEALLKRDYLAPANHLLGPFEHTFSALDPTDETPPPPEPMFLAPNRGDEQGDGELPDDGQGKDGSPNQGNGNGGGQGENQTIDDIVRRIAGELDEVDRLATLETFATREELARTLSEFQPKLGGGDGAGDGELYTITTRIEVKRAEVKLQKDGIFHKQFDKLTKLVAAGQHCYLPGPPGTGKSHAADQVASVLDWRFASISLGPTTTESRLWGGMDAHGKFFEPPFIKLARHAMDNPESGSVYCLDELDNGNAGIIATLNSAMANGWFTAPNGDVITMGKNFVIVGAANTFGTGPTAEFAGRNKLDAATLDRFAYLPWDTDLAVEKALVLQYLDTQSARAWLEVWRTCRKNAKDHGLKVFVTMRGCVNGARLIASGLDASDVLDMVLLNKLPEDQARKVKP
jgi:cobaltochelatase CobS